MRRFYQIKILLIVLLLLKLTFVKGQTYYPLLGNYNEWYVVYNGFESTTTVIYSTTDSIINGNLYKDVKIGGVYHYAFIREDTLNKKVWIISKDSINERILYDFSLQEGDSIFLSFKDSVNNYYGVNNDLKTGWYYVDSIRSVSILAGIRRIWYLTSPNNSPNPYCTITNNIPILEWIEGVGSTLGPTYLDESVICLDCDYFSTFLLCSFKNGNHEYFDIHNKESCLIEDQDTCVIDLIGGLKNNYAEKTNKNTLFPNPVINESYINISNFNAVSYIVIYDIMGRIIKKIPIKENNKISIYKNDYKPGIYFYKIIEKSGNAYVGKFFVIN